MKEHVIINLDRTVNVPESMKKIGIQYDHNVKTITFDCPRYPDENQSVDMSTMKIFINWMLPDKTLGSTIATNVCVDSENENLMHFDWVITKAVTSVSGVLSTLICIKETTETGEETYHWNSELIQSFKVGNGMECTEEIVEQNIDVITQLLVQMDAVDARTSTEAMQGYVDTSVNTYLNQNPITPTDEQATTGINTYMNNHAQTEIDAYMTENAQSCVNNYLTEHPISPTEEQMKQGVAANSEMFQSSVDDYLGRNPLQLDNGLTETTKAAPANKVGEIQSDVTELKGDLDSFTSKNKNMLTGRYSPISSDGTSLSKYIYYVNGEKVSVTLDKGTYAICAYIKTTSENNATNADNITLQSVGGTNIKYIGKASSTFTNTKEAVLMQVFSLSQSTNVTFRFLNANIAGTLSFTIENLVLVNVTDVNEAYSYLGKVANGYNDRIVKPIGVNQCAFLEPSVNLLDDSSFSDNGTYRSYTIPNIDVSKTYTVSVFCNLDTAKIVRATLRNGYEYNYLNIISTASNDSFTFKICESNDAIKLLDSKWRLDIDVYYDGQKVMLTEGTETYDHFIPYSRFDSIVNSSEFINKVKEIAGEGGTTPAFNPKYIACIGDSLTKGWGGDAPSDVFGNSPVNYPDLLQNLIGNQFIVKNFGIAGEDSHAIFARQGSEPIVVKDVTIPSTTDAVELGSKESPLTTVLGNQLKTLMLTGDYGVNPCSIAGVDGLLSYNNQKYTFTRLQGGSAVSITRETPLITNMGANYIRNEIPIIWAGTNGTYSSNADLINQIQLAIDHAQCNDKFMVLGLAYDGEYILKNLESDMVAAFGDKFINVRDYLSKNGLSDAGLSATDDDITAMSKGKVPPSLMNDTVHFNGYGYIVLANLVYNKGKELGYWK